MGKELGKWWRNRTAVAVLWVTISLGICIGLHWYFRWEGMKKAEDSLISMCDERARMLQEQFHVSVNHVHALAILVSTFNFLKQPTAMDQMTFAHYTKRTSFERPLLNGVAYAARVLHSERENFENSQGWTIKTMTREPSPMQDEYAPVIFSQETVSYIEAIDMMSGEEDRENILRSRATGKAVLTRPFRLLGSNHLGVVLTFPVYRLDLPVDAAVQERIAATAGYIGGAFDVESLVENLLRQLAGNQDILVNVYDITNSSTPLVMYGPENPEGYTSLSHDSTLDFGDPYRKHKMQCRYSVKPPMSLAAITTPSGVFVICMLAGYIIYAAWNRYDNVKEDCRKMEELKVKAESADVAKSQFLATVSHEIRTPMNGVLGMLDMLLDTDMNLTQKEYAQTAQICGKALISLINEVLDRAKIEAGKLELEAVPFDVRSILDDVLSLFSSQSREKGIELAVFVSDRVPEVLTGDPGRFRQIITNLVGNSVKFTEHGHIFVQVHLAEASNKTFAAKVEPNPNESLDEPQVNSDATNIYNTLSGLEAADDRNSWENFKTLLSCEKFNCAENDSRDITVMVTVEDTGIGIPLNAQERVFAPFMQADSSTSRNYGGTGIGLSISKCLVELMGGQISFISRPNVGSTFTFTAVFQESTKGINELKGPIAEALPTCFKGMKVVLVDKKPVRASVTLYHLHRLGIDVDVVSDITHGLLALAEKNGYSRETRNDPKILLMEKDSCGREVDSSLYRQLQDLKIKGQIQELPKVIILGTCESDKANTGSFVSTVIMKPIKSGTIAACFQQVMGLGRQQKKEMQNGSAFLRGLLVGKNILVVDDNKVNLKIAAAALKKYGAKVECAESGKDAIALLQLPHNFDACFMDVQMPEMDGFEATRQIRLMESKVNIRCGDSNDEWHIPILAMTADVIQATYEKCLKSGMDGYVSKPFDEEQLYQAVAKFLVSKRVHET